MSYYTYLPCHMRENFRRFRKRQEENQTIKFNRVWLCIDGENIGNRIEEAEYSFTRENGEISTGTIYGIRKAVNGKMQAKSNEISAEEGTEMMENSRWLLVKTTLDDKVHIAKTLKENGIEHDKKLYPTVIRQ